MTITTNLVHPPILRGTSLKLEVAVYFIGGSFYPLAGNIDLAAIGRDKYISYIQVGRPILNLLVH
jgi:hypothetical protein